FTDWVSPSDVLGEILMARGLVSTKACMSAIEQSQQGKGPVGAQLIAAGKLDANTLSKALRLQCSRKLLHTFAMRSGEILIEPGKPSLPPDLNNPVNVLQLIRTGVQLHFDEARIRSEMGTAADAAMVTTDAFQRYRDNFGFRDEDSLLLRDFSKGTRIDSLKHPGISIKRAMQLAYTLWACQMLVVGSQAKSAVDQIRESVAGPPTTNFNKNNRPKTLVGLQAVPDSTTSGTYPVEAGDESPAANSGKFPVQKDPAPAAATAPAPEDPPQAPATPESMTPAQRAFEARLRGFEEKIEQRLNAFMLLGVPLDADRRAIRASWNELSKDLHPDRLVASGLTALAPRVEAVFAALSEANATLSNRDQREKLRAHIESGGSGAPGEDATALMRKALEAEVVGREGERLLKAGNYARALEKFEESLELSNADPNVKVYESWCRYQIAEREEQAQQKTIRILQTIVEDTPTCANAFYYMGLIFIHQNDVTNAKVALNSALSHNPRLTDAERQLRALQIRSRSASAGPATKASPQSTKTEKSGGLRGLFGKK
ncbi:MAG: J domain-containing protein, partial [Nannocystaceae bacterium]